jgi:sigma-B regulation protein RsbU (phosphoserine phosphatase)
MQKQTLTILSSATLVDHSRTLACLIEACWWDAGDTPRPRIKLITADETGDVSAIRGCDAALVLLDDGEPTSETFQLLDELEQHHIATLVLASSPVTQGPKLGGLHWLPLEVDPERLTATLESLLVRQREVRRLAQEVTLAQRLQGGLTGEMNKMHEELELAASVQREFLPKDLPQADGFEFGVMYRPCSYVSGDIYGVLPVDDAHIGFFLADATGHGVPAALMTVMIARAMHMVDNVFQRPRLLSPGEAMGRLNEELAARGTGAGRFATAVCGVIDIDVGTRDDRERRPSAGPDRRPGWSATGRGRRMPARRLS